MDMLNRFIAATTEQPVAPVAAGTLTWLWWPIQSAALPPSVLFWALVGTGIGLFLQPPDGSRARTFGLGLCYTLLAAAVAVVMVQFSVLAFLRPVAPLIAMLTASGAQMWLPEAREAIRTRIRRTLSGDPQ